MAPVLHKRIFCFNHYELKPAGKLPQHEEKEKELECPSSIKTGGRPTCGRVYRTFAFVFPHRTHQRRVKIAFDRVSHSSIHDALIIIRSVHFLRTSIFVNVTVLGKFDGALSSLVATRASHEKINKYDRALSSLEFLPVCIEVLGLMDNNT
ncbi:hypothetical protein HELRODRAFT_174207 [Helobdella robusta]|uniref:Uncharacterized protein n=1 Tax=Helobdella robusta TaxID=6412 RepID=T1F7S6_HELRO|nr:hypothetical protein HELRODRAFT_174207 [Helobdella robusta]ESO02789.1 hypothetical protein HELRODRAFT_174207 [Helobdella robusta]